MQRIMKMGAAGLLAVASMFLVAGPASATIFEDYGISCTDSGVRKHSNKVTGGLTNRSQIASWYKESPSNSSAFRNSYFHAHSSGYGGYANHKLGSYGNYAFTNSYGYCRAG